MVSQCGDQDVRFKAVCHLVSPVGGVNPDDPQYFTKSMSSGQSGGSDASTAMGAASPPAAGRVSVRYLCCLFCCPPFPSSIVSKLAFMPPESSYTITESNRLHLLEGRAEWPHDPEYLTSNVEMHVARTRRRNKISCVYVRPAPNAYFTLLFSHGNAVDIGQMTSFYWGLGHRLGCNVFSYDYSGYGCSTGRPSEKNLYADITCAFETLKTKFVTLSEIQEAEGSNVLEFGGVRVNCQNHRNFKAFLCFFCELYRTLHFHFSTYLFSTLNLFQLFCVPADRIILYGQSIGTVPSVDLASREEVAALILHSPLMSGMRVAFPGTQRTWCCDAFPSIEKVPRVKCPTLVIHGTDDEVIDFSHGVSIYERCPASVEPLWVSGNFLC
ncbi:hypothetical protein Y032_0006g2873 [Ancylostoma ceylanicum]|uniref:Serine aminopeptidase S33 domain-containing protein n=1 Tax=Ancylostoma ceylanicum TaxID=53326 RepID=A0A016VPB6_9BILA|nr:hypothetical protein Y032_0006g2873 [Ancylostoma ceylanicum]